MVDLLVLLEIGNKDIALLVYLVLLDEAAAIQFGKQILDGNVFIVRKNLPGDERGRAAHPTLIVGHIEQPYEQQASVSRKFRERFVLP